MHMWLNTHKSNTHPKSYQVNKERNNVIISADTETVFNTIQQQGTVLKIIKVIYHEIIANIVLHREKAESISLFF